MKTIACVYKSGVFMNRHNEIEYSAAQVRWLRDQVEYHYGKPHRFICLSDVNISGVETIPLKYNWPGWWSKIELFRPSLELGDVFYIDLDTVIVDDITHMIEYDHGFSVLRNLSRNHGIGSGIMAFKSPLTKHLFEIFAADPAKHMARYVTPKLWGDQGFIQEHQAVNGGWDHLQDQFPGQIISHKFGMGGKGDPPPGVKIVVFHGAPKPWEVKAAWIPPMKN